MAVYVDSIVIVTPKENGTKRRGFLWCHMIADTPEELRSMADKIRVSDRYLQHAGTEKEHYDLTPPRRAKAVSLGAIELSPKDLVRKIGEKRNAGTESSPASDEADPAVSPVWTRRHATHPMGNGER